MSGERAAVEAVLATIDEDEAEQLGLFAEPATPEGRRRMLISRPPGRPPGSRNKRTERTVQWLLARHRDPRAVLLEIAEANLHDLAVLLGCTLFEAMQEKRLAAIGVLPYVAQKLPLAVDVTNRQVYQLTIVKGAAEPAGVGVAARIIENVQIQEVSEDAPDEV